MSISCISDVDTFFLGGGGGGGEGVMRVFLWI